MALILEKILETLHLMIRKKHKNLYHYLRDVLKEAGLEPKHNCEFFHEFVTVSPEGGCTDSAHILRALESKGIPVSYTHLDVYKRQGYGDQFMD